MASAWRWVTSRLVLLVLSAVALLGAGAAFSYSLAQTRALAQQNRVIVAAQAGETRRHCLADAVQDDRRRRLDLRLIAADRATLLRLRALPYAGPGDHELHLTLIAYYSAALAARLADIPPYVSPRACAGG